MTFDDLILECRIDLQTKSEVLKVSVPLDLVDITIEDLSFLGAHQIKNSINFPILELPMSDLKIFHSLGRIEKLLLKTHHFLGLYLHGFATQAWDARVEVQSFDWQLME